MIMRAFSKISKNLAVIAFLAGLIAGCVSESGKDGAVIFKSSPFPEIQDRTDVTAVLKVGGSSCLLTVDPVTTLLHGQCADFPLGTHSYRLEYLVGGIVIAGAEGAVTIPEGGTAEATIPPLDTSMNDDEDGFINLMEVINGTDPTDPNSPIQLIVTPSGTGSGTVTSSPPGIDCGPDCSEVYNPLAVVTLTAAPAAGSSFTGWSGDCIGTNPSPTVTMDASKTCDAAFNQIWTISTIDSNGFVGQYTSMALDSNNKVHISYYDVTNSALKYASNASGLWVLSTVDDAGNVGLFTSIALDSIGKVHISYYDGSNSALKYATNASVLWASSTVDDAGNVGLYTSIALDSNGKIHIGYFDSDNTALKVANNTGGSWDAATIDNSGATGQYPSLAVDGAGKTHISYSDITNGDLKQAESIPPVTLFNDDFETGLEKWTYDFPWDLTASSFHSGSNSATDSPGGVNYSSGINISLTMTDPIAVNGTAELSFWHQYSIEDSADCDADCARIEISTDGGVNWIQLDRYWGLLTPWAPVSIDLSRYINPSVKIRFRLSTNPNSGGSDGWYIDDIAITQTFLTSTIDDAGAVGDYTSIDLDSNNKVHISYYDATQSALKYATNVSGLWATSTVDDAGDVGTFTSIAVDSNGKMHIGYFDATNNTLKYATNQ